jgi:hypothetical protein
MEKDNPRISIFPFVLGAWACILFFSPGGCAGQLTFSKTEKLASLPWSNGTNHGVSLKGPDWLMVDSQGRFILESELDFNVYDHKGRFLQTFNPIDKTKNFFGFTSMETLAEGEIALLEQLESPLEQWNKDNFEEQAKPGARLIIFGADGKVSLEKEEVDAKQPHSRYYLKDGIVYSIHDDGSYEVLDSLKPDAPKDSSFGDFAAIAFNSERWREHIEKLPVFRSENKTYHDVNGNLHQDKAALSFLMGHLYVEGTGAVAEKNGKTYYQVLCDHNRQFANAIFVEDIKNKSYALVDLVPADPDLDIAHTHTVFVDEKGDIYEGVAKKDGYQIYKWSLLR